MIDQISTINVLSSMITPVVLIMAVGSFIISTAQRLGRSIDRSRAILEQLREVYKSKEHHYSAGEVQLLKNLLRRSSSRSRLLQRSLAMLYFALIFFVLTSIILGFSFLVEWTVQWLSVFTGLGGAVLLLISAVLLIMDSRLALRSINEETKWTRHINTEWFQEREIKDTGKI